MNSPCLSGEVKCRNVPCDNADGTKGVCARGDEDGHCIACDDGRGNWTKPCKWWQPTCLKACGRTEEDIRVYNTWRTVRSTSAAAGLRT